MSAPDDKPTEVSSPLSEGVDRLRQELVQLSERLSRDKTILVSRGRGIFSASRCPR